MAPNKNRPAGITHPDYTLGNVRGEHLKMEMSTDTYPVADTSDDI